MVVYDRPAGSGGDGGGHIPSSAVCSTCPTCPVTVETLGIARRLIERAHEFVIGQSGLQLMLEQRKVVQLHTLMASLMKLFRLYCALGLWGTAGGSGIAIIAGVVFTGTSPAASAVIAVTITFSVSISAVFVTITVTAAADCVFGAGTPIRHPRCHTPHAHATRRHSRSARSTSCRNASERPGWTIQSL